MKQERRYQKIISINKNGKFIGTGVKSEKRVKPKGRPILTSHQPEHELLNIETTVPTINNIIIIKIFLQSGLRNCFHFTINLSPLRTKIYLISNTSSLS